MLGSLEPTTVVKTILSFLEMCEDLSLERVDVGRQRSSYQLVGLQSLVCLWKESPPAGVQGFEAGLRKQQIHNVFANQEALRVANFSPLTSIDTFSGARNGKITADFYDDCPNIPDSSVLDMQKNLLLLDDCFLGKQNKAEAYYTRSRHNNFDTIYIVQNYFRLPRHTVRENSNFIILFPQYVKNLTHIHADHCASDISLPEFKQFCHGVWSAGGAGHNFVAIDLTSTPTNGKYRQNFNRFYFPVNCK